MSVEDGIPEGGQANEAPQHDWEKDYKELQATYTRGQQELSQLRSQFEDPTAYLEHGKTKGWVEFDEPAEPDSTVNPDVAATQAELAEIKAWKEQVEAERQQQQFENGRRAVMAQHAEWADEAGLALTDFDHAALIQSAIDNGAGTVDEAKDVFDRWAAHRKAEREALEADIRESMKRPRVPHTPTSGGTETGVVDYDGMSRAEINRVMAEQVRAASQR